MKRTASAEWKGNLKAGKGAISTASSVLDNTPYGYSSRFEGAKGTNPEELIAAVRIPGQGERDSGVNVKSVPG